MIELVPRDEVVRLLRSGRVVAVPTDTVYGVAAALTHPRAVAKLFSVKRRPSDAALPVLVDSLAAIEGMGVTWPERAGVLARAFWPGALTIVVGVDARLAQLVGSTTQTVGFRVPKNELLRDVLVDCGPLAVTSANEHGEPPCQSAEEVMSAFVDSPELDGVLDGGLCSGAVSTVVEIYNDGWRVLRHGSIGASDIEAALA
jgi:tRNA threonylcarbamoyl adenosine modification protein (Sua5/YciO/YrdC/YwlC family)